jgi:polygalacturonase
LACSKAGGGKVLVPKGKWLTGAIRMHSNVNLHLDPEAEIIFSTNFADYLPVVFSRFEGIEYYNFSPPIYANGAVNIALTGEGKINGQGDIFWWKQMTKSMNPVLRLYALAAQGTPVAERIFGMSPDGLRPSFVQFINAQIVLIDGPTFINGPMWTLHPVYSDEITIRNVKIKTFPGKSTDGIVVDSSKNVLIEKVYLETGDDAIVMKSGRDKDGLRINRPTENVVIRDCQIQEAHGAIVIGSEMSGGVKNIFAENIKANNSFYGFRLKSNPGRGGKVEKIWVQNMQIARVSFNAIQVEADYERSNPLNSDDAYPELKDIHISNFTCEKANQKAIYLNGLPQRPLKNIYLDHVYLYGKRGGAIINNAENIFMNEIKIETSAPPAFAWRNVQNILLENSFCQETFPCLKVSGNLSQNIQLKNNNFGLKSILAGENLDPTSLKTIINLTTNP